MDGAKLLEWWDKNRADLPWRVNPTPYSVWVSEIMLQQTVVKAVVSHYERWIRRWPTLVTLAQASEQAVTRMWEGLGYYSRARNLHAAARIVVEKHGSRLPDTYRDLVALPGIGDYTARAILSIAHGKAVTLIDANVRRVLQRLGAWREWDASARRSGGELIAQMLVHDRPGDFNQAFMELGQRVCTKRNPVCPECPFAMTCSANSQGLQSQIPASRRTVTVQRESRVLIVVHDNQVWLSQPGTRLFRGLWTFPRVPVDKVIDGEPEAVLTTRTHSYTRYRERLHPEVHRITSALDEGPFGLTGGQWVPGAELDAMPFPSVHRNIVEEMKRYLANHE